MAQPSSSLPVYSKDSRPPNKGGKDSDADDVELRGLLSGVQANRRRDTTEKRGLGRFTGWFENTEPWSRKHMGLIAGILIALLLGAALVPRDLFSGRSCRKNTHPNSKFVGTELRSNGTHDFKRTVLIVSIDGLR